MFTIHACVLHESKHLLGEDDFSSGFVGYRTTRTMYVLYRRSARGHEFQIVLVDYIKKKTS